MKKNMKHLFLVTTLLVLLVGLTALSATDVSDNSTITDTQLQTPSTSSIENVDAVQTDHKEVQSTKSSVNKKTKQIKKETKQENRTVTDYNSLKQTWNEIETNGTTDTEYTINVKNGEYKFEDRLVFDNKNVTTVNIIGEDTDKTIFNGQNNSMFYFNDTLTGVKTFKFNFKNITFTNSSDSRLDAIVLSGRTNSSSIENCKFSNNFMAIDLVGNINITNSSFEDNNGSTAIVRYYNNLNLFNCTFINNNGSTLYKNSYTTTLNCSNCNFINNHAGTHVIIHISEGSTNYQNNFYNCYFSNNTVEHGKSIFGQGVPLGVKFDNCYFEGIANPVSQAIKQVIGNYVEVLPNGKNQGSIFTQKDKVLTFKAVLINEYNDYTLTNTTGYIIPVTASSNYINTTGVVLSPENNYTASIDLTGLPSDFENFTISVGGIETAMVTCKKTDITLNPVTVKTGSSVTFNATFKDNGYFIEKGHVAFKINGKTIGHSDVQFGKASLTYKLPLHSAKDYTLNVVYGGNNKYNEARVNTTLTLTKISSKSIITTSNAVANNKMQITVRTIGADNNTVNSGKIAVKVNKKTIKVLKTNGTVTVTFNVPKSWNNRNITIQTAYSGNGVYEGSRDETSLVIKQVKSSIKSNSLKTVEAQNNYYVSSTTGSDNNTGSQTSPFKTIARVINAINSTKTPSNVYLTGTFKGAGNTNLTVPGDLYINFIGLNGAVIDGEANYTMKTTLEPGEYYWNSRPEWMPYVNASGNYAMTITKGSGYITISNMTITKCWSSGGSSIDAYKTATVDNYGNLEVNNVNFTYNCAGVGAGIRNNVNATVIVMNSLFDANRKSSSTGNDGAGIYNNGTATIINSTFQNNWARWGTITNDGVMKVFNSTIRDNIGYDGGSTYKAGSGIVVNTGSADYYYIHDINGLSTVIDGCTFINNDQLDISAGKGQLNLTNNIFNQSTGVIIPEAPVQDAQGLNLTLQYKISNNTFINPIGSSIYTSLSSTDKKIIVLVLEGAYNYTVENNKVFNITGTQSRAMQLNAGQALIKNNTFTRTIEINSENNIIQDNNITTTQDIYAINMKSSKNNVVKNNYLITDGYRGNDAVNYSSTTNIIENNTPVLTSIKVDDSTFNHYFDNEGNLLTQYDAIKQIEIKGTLTNRNITLNRTISISQIDTKFTSYNITIKTVGNGKADIRGLKIINDEEPAIIINSNNNNIERNDIKTNNKYTIIVTGTNNTIKENNLITEILVGDKSVQTVDSNNITDNTPTYTNHILSQDTYDNYFNADGTIKVDEDAHFIVNGTITNKEFILNNNHTITITNYNDAKLVNSTVTTIGNTTLNITYITITNTNNNSAINLNTPVNYINYNNIQTNTNAINIINTTNLKLSYNNITANSTENVTAISIKDSHKIWKSQGDNSDPIQITNNNILTIGPETQINNNKLIGTQSIEVVNTLGIVISSNSITTKCNNMLNGTIYSINIINNNISDNEYVYEYERHFDRISYNTINTYGNNRAYGINYMNKPIYLTGNTITTNATETVGIQLINTTQGIFQSTYDVSRNNIISSGIKVYGIKIINSTNLPISRNEFILNANNSVGILINNSNNNNITNNNFQVNGNSIKAIEITKSEQIQITDNRLNINSTGNNSPIELINTTKTNINKNTIITNTNYTILIDENSTDNTITNNTLYADTLFADTSVNRINNNNRVRENKPTTDVNFYLNDKTYNQFFNDNGTLKDEIPEAITIQQTGTLHNKILNITKPVNIISEETFFSNSTLIISADNTNITGITLEGEKSEIIINGNNNNIHIANINIENTETKKLTPLIINGNNNNINIQNNKKEYIEISSNKELNSDITLFTINGYNNTLNNNVYIRSISNFNNVTIVLVNNTYNNTIRINQEANIHNTNRINTMLVINSNNNILRPSVATIYDAVIEFNGLILDNSSYNNITGSSNFGSIDNVNNNYTMLNLKNNSNYNNISSYRLNTNSEITKTPIIIENSHYNNITDSQFIFKNYQGHVIRINESVGNIIEYNYIKTLNLDGDLSVIQENQNNTVNNIVRYNRAVNTGSTIRFRLTGPNSIEVGDTIQLTANITYKNGTKWNSPYVPLSNGTVTFMVNGVEETYNLINGTVIFNYTVNNYNNGQITIKTIYNDPNEVYRYTTTTKTISVLKHETTLNLGNFTNNGITSILTAVVTDIDGKIVDNGTIVFRVNDEIIGTVDITNKVAVLPVSVANYKAGTYNITATYNDNDYYLSCNTTGLFTVNKYNAKASITPVTAKAGETVTLTSIIRDVNGNLVDNGVAVFKLNNKTLKDEFGETIYANVHNGIASINYTIPDNYSAKDYNLTVVTSGDTYKRAENTTKLTITKHNAQILLEPIHVTRSNNTNIKIEIVDENGNPITGSTKVAVKFNGKTQLHTRATNGILDFNMDLTNYKHDSYDFSVVISGNSIYNNARASNIIFLE